MASSLAKGNDILCKYEICRHKLLLQCNYFPNSYSVAILKYLCRCYLISGNWCPQSIQEAARVDEFMSWQHLNLRTVISKYFRLKVILSETVDTPKELMAVEKELETMLEQLEDIWLVPNCYINGSKFITIADLLAISELEQLGMCTYQI